MSDITRHFEVIFTSFSNATVVQVQIKWLCKMSIFENTIHQKFQGTQIFESGHKGNHT